MSQKLPQMLENTMIKIREMVDSNSVVGEPISVADGVMIIPISKINVGFGGGGSDFATKNTQSDAFGGGVAGGVKVTPVAFLVIKDGNVRMVPVAVPANTTADRLVEMIPDALDKVTSFFDSRAEKQEKKPE